MNVSLPSQADPPFAIPPDIVLDLPAPPSVNKVRRIDWANHRAIKRWKRGADGYVFAAKCRSRDPLKLNKIGRFELFVTLSETHSGADLDNILKVLIDYLRQIELIADDGPAHMRALHVAWGFAPEGCRVIVRPSA
jgi:Holliday junction resolvase RusA-like endonuclease